MKLNHNYHLTNKQKTFLILFGLLSILLIVLALPKRLHSSETTYQKASPASAYGAVKVMPTSLGKPKLKPKTPQPVVPKPANPTPQNLSFNHIGIISTIFWAGEDASGDNGFISNAQSAWDESWGNSFGGIDDPNNRSGYLPKSFIPKENAFYFALPYNDLNEEGGRRPSAKSCPLYNSTNPSAYSWCKNAWIAIKRGDKVAYAQWEDVGPYHEDDINYVFGTASPKNKTGQKAGIDVSPATKTYLGLGDVDQVDWVFVPFSAVPDGPWKATITTSLGYKVE